MKNVYSVFFKKDNNIGKYNENEIYNIKDFIHVSDVSTDCLDNVFSLMSLMSNSEEVYKFEDYTRSITVGDIIAIYKEQCVKYLFVTPQGFEEGKLKL